MAVSEAKRLHHKFITVVNVVCVCMHTHTCTCTCVHVHACTCVCMHAHTCTCTCTCVCTCMHVCMQRVKRVRCTQHVQCMHTMCVCTCACTCVCVCVLQHMTGNPQRADDRSARSSVAFVQRPWPLAKGSGFILVSERSPVFIFSVLQTCQVGWGKGVGLGSRSMMQTWRGGGGGAR